MRIIHIADPHLGFRAWTKVNNDGLNVREFDVLTSFAAAMKKAAGLDCDLILIAGDLFHVVRPSNYVIKAAYSIFSSVRKITKTPIVIIGGNHDTPKTTEQGCILDLFSNIDDIYVVHKETKRLIFDDLNLSLLCVPYNGIENLPTTDIVPDDKFKYNVLMMHGSVSGLIYNSTEQTIGKDIIDAEGWDYIALGHYHKYVKYNERAYYSGSVDYASTNIWDEKEPKGFIEYDLDEHRLVNFHKTKTREIIILPEIDAINMTSEDINESIRSNIEAVDYKDKMVRQVVKNIHKSVMRSIDYAFIGEIRSGALYFDLDRSYINDTGLPPMAEGGLENVFPKFVQDCTLPAEIDKEEFIKMGLRYLEDAK